MRKSLLAIAASAVGALSLSVSAAEPKYQASNDGRYRGVNIINRLPMHDSTTSGWPRPYGIVTMIGAKPHSGPTTIVGDRIPDGAVINPGESLMVIFDDGYGACVYDVTFYTRDADYARAVIDVCSTRWFAVSHQSTTR